MFEEWEVGREIQDYVNLYGLGISKKELVNKTYRYLDRNEHECVVLNDIYLMVDGEVFQLLKSRKQNKWIVKEF